MTQFHSEINPNPGTRFFLVLSPDRIRFPANLNPGNIMNTYITRAFLVVSGVCLFFAPHHSFALDQPLMRDAIALLRQAKTADDPLPLLQKAWKELKNGEPNKGGYRIKAMEEVKEAIDDANAGKKDAMLDKINHAISEVWSAIGRGAQNEQR